MSDAGEKTDSMRRAYAVTGKMFRDRLVRERPEEAGELVLIQPAEVPAVRGQFDHLHRVLEATAVPFLDLPPEALPRADRDRVQVLLINGRGNCRGGPCSESRPGSATEGTWSPRTGRSSTCWSRSSRGVCAITASRRRTASCASNWTAKAPIPCSTASSRTVAIRCRGWRHRPARSRSSIRSGSASLPAARKSAQSGARPHSLALYRASPRFGFRSGRTCRASTSRYPRNGRARRTGRS